MTVASQTSRADYTGNGSTTVFAVPFYFLDNTHLLVLRTDNATSPATVDTLALGVDYTVSGAANPAGGSITLTVAPTAQMTLAILRDVPFTQLTEYVPNDPFPAKSHERALDKLTMGEQQLAEQIGRALTLPPQVPSGASTELPAPEANALIGWNDAANALQNVDPVTLATIVAFATGTVDIFDGNGVQQDFVLSANPGALANLHVSIGTADQRPGVDFTWSGGTTLHFVTAPPLGTQNILVQYMQALPQGTTDSAASMFVQAGAGAVQRTAQNKLREIVSVTDFGADGTGASSSNAAFAAAQTAANGMGVLVPAGTYALTGRYTGNFYSYGNVTVTGGASIYIKIIPVASDRPINLVVGNDPAYSGSYDFSDLIDAIKYCTGVKVAGGKNDSARYNITIPVGTHTFSALNLRGVDLSGIQVWGADKNTCIVKCRLSNVTDGTWLNANFSNFSDWGNFTLIPSDECTVITDPAIVCQSWYGGAVPPWSPAQPMVFISLNGCSVGRFWGMNFDGNTAGCRLATALNISGSNANVDGISISNIRSSLFAYDGAVVAVGYEGITGSGVYEGIVCHDAKVTVRRVQMSGKLNGAVPYTGSLFCDSFQGDVSVWNGGSSAPNSIAGFDRLVFLSGGRYFDQTPAAYRSNINRLIDRYESSPGVYCANIVSIDADFLPDADILSKDVILYNGSEAKGTGLITYTGNAETGRALAVPLQTKKITVRNTVNGSVVSCIRGQFVSANGDNAAWISSSDGVTRVYPGMNAAGISYELIWER